MMNKKSVKLNNPNFQIYDKAQNLTESIRPYDYTEKAKDPNMVKGKGSGN